MPSSREILLPVEGMTCATCSNRIEKVVGKLAGVGSVNVNLATERAAVSFEPEATSVEAITDALRIEVRPFGIRVVAIRPGFIATEFNEVGNQMTGNLMDRTDPEYQPLYAASGAAVGKLFVGATVPEPDLIADLIAEAVLSENPKPVYSAGFMSEEWLEARARMDDDAFDRFLAETTGLLDLKV